MSAGKDWDNHWKTKYKNKNISEIYHEFYYKISEFLPLMKNKSVLEVGSGTGRIPFSLKKNNEFDLTLLDYSKDVLNLSKKLAKKMDIKGVNFVRGDCLNLPFKNNIFDFVFSIGLNEHFYGLERQKVFDEMARVCKKGKYVLVITPHLSSMPLQFYLFLTRFVGSQKGYEKDFTINEMTNKMKKAGLSIVNTGEFQYLDSLSYFIPKIGPMLLKKLRKTLNINDITSNNQRDKNLLPW